MSEQKTLTMEEYSRLFEHIILAEYDNLFLNADLRHDLGLNSDQTRRLAVEYLCAALSGRIPQCGIISAGGCGAGQQTAGSSSQ